jgi:hypothetical protein
MLLPTAVTALSTVAMVKGFCVAYGILVTLHKLLAKYDEEAQSKPQMADQDDAPHHCICHPEETMGGPCGLLDLLKAKMHQRNGTNITPPKLGTLT